GLDGRSRQSRAHPEALSRQQFLRHRPGKAQFLRSASQQVAAGADFEVATQLQKFRRQGRGDGRVGGLEGSPARPASPPASTSPRMNVAIPVAGDTEEARRSVIDAARSMFRSGLVASPWGNVSARVRDSGIAVVTPSGVEYDALEPEMLCLVEVS